MTAPDLPKSLKEQLASEAVRTRHHLWHLVRNLDAWNGLSDADRTSLAAAGWRAPRFETEPIAGLDFLYMHRQMIQMVNTTLAGLSDPFWKRVEGWNPIPWEANNAEWPVPAWPSPHPAAAWARDPTTVAAMKIMVNDRFQNPAWLKTVTLDELGTAMEFSFHAWMHLRWSGSPPSDINTADPSNDWLFVPWSSHVNKHFWKLHGWIDERIADWEKANGTTADFTGAWTGPVGHGATHDVSAEMLTFVSGRDKQELPMLPKDLVIEGLLSGDPPGAPPPAGGGSGGGPGGEGGGNDDDRDDSGKTGIVNRVVAATARTQYETATVILLLVVLLVVIVSAVVLDQDLLIRMSSIENARGLITYTFTMGVIFMGVILMISVLIGRAGEWPKIYERGKDIFTILVGLFGTVLGYYFAAGNDDTTLPLTIANPIVSPAEPNEGTEADVTAFVYGGQPPYTYSISIKGETETPVTKQASDWIEGAIHLPEVENDSTVIVVIEVNDSAGNTRTTETAKIPVKNVP